MKFLIMIKNHWKKILIGFGVAPFVLWIGLVWLMKTDELVTVTGKETKIINVVMIDKVDKRTGKTVQVPKNVERYYVYTNKGAFQYHQSWFFFQINVADPFGALEIGKTYNFTHYWFRNALFDQYENIVGYEEVNQ